MCLDDGMVPSVALAGLLAFLALDGLRLVSFRVGGVAKLHKCGLSLPRALDGRGEEAVCAILDHGLHGLAEDLGDEHAGAEAVARLDGNPFEAIVFDV